MNVKTNYMYYMKKFTVGDKPLEKVKEYKYLGVIFTKQNNLKKSYERWLMLELV